MLKEKQLILRDALAKLLAAAIEIDGASFGNVQVYNPKLQSLEIVVQIGFKDDFLRFFRFVGVSDGSACSRALRERRRVVIPDVNKDIYFAPYIDVARSAGFSAVQSTPIIGSTGSVLGVLSTHHEDTYDMPAESAAAMDRIASELARLIEQHGQESGELRR